MAAVPRLRSRPDERAGIVAVVLPSDAVYEILLRLPAKELCRLRAVCRACRSLLSDPHFVSAHTARHPAAPPLIVVGYNTAHRNDGVLCDIMDPSGRIVKRVRAATGAEEAAKKKNQWMCVMYTYLDVLCVMKGFSLRWQLVNLANGAARALPEGLAAEHAPHVFHILGDLVSAVFGMVASTGECKVLRIFRAISAQQPRQLYEVLSLDGSNQQPRWRAKKAPPYHVVLKDYWASGHVVVNGIVYFLLLDPMDQDSDQDLVASFDLETEEWSASVRGPLSNPVDDDVGVRYISWGEISLAALSGCLIMGCSKNYSSTMDIWFLVDFEKDLWVKQHSIETSELCARIMSSPLLVLNDGRIVFNTGALGGVRIYDPRTATCTDLVKFTPYAMVSLYTGSLLSLANDAR